MAQKKYIPRLCVDAAGDITMEGIVKESELTGKVFQPFTINASRGAMLPRLTCWLT